MAVWHGKSKRKSTGGLLRLNRNHKKYELGREPIKTVIGTETKKRIVRVRGGNTKVKIRVVDKINVVDKNNKTYVAKLVKVIENKANPHFVKHNMITKGTIVETDKGLVKVTSRPGQDGTINGVVVE